MPDTEWCLHKDCMDSSQAFDTRESLDEHMIHQHGTSLSHIEEDPWEMVHEEEEEEEEEVVVEMEDDLPMQILPGLYLGSIDAAYNNEALAHRSITRSLRCCCDSDVVHTGKSIHVVGAREDTLVLDWIDTEDQDIFCGLYDALDFLLAGSREGRSTLVYCIAGRSRSVVVVCCWLIARYGRTLDEAMDAIQMVRPWVQPNGHFVKQLQQFDQMFAKSSEELDAARGLIPLNASVLRYLPRIDFHESFVEDLKDGSKGATTRVRGEHDTDVHSQLDALGVGNLCIAVVSGNQAVVMLRVTKIEERKVCEIDDELAQIENLSSGRELQELLPQFYPLVCPDDPIQVIHFLRPLDYDMIHCQ